MNRFACAVSLLALGCGSDPQVGAADSGAESGAHCVQDCKPSWACVDSTHWVETQPSPLSTCATGCIGTSTSHTCDPGLECVKNAMTISQPRCAYGGVDGCMPSEAGAFAPDAGAITTPVKQPGACDLVGIEQTWSRCIDPTTKDDADCKYWQDHYTPCMTCLGPVLTLASSDDSFQFPTLLPNIAACYAFYGEASCAAAADANMQCAMAVCQAGCETDPQAYEACIRAVRTTACAAFPTCGADAGTAYATCEPATTKDFFFGFGEALCGP